MNRFKTRWIALLVPLLFAAGACSDLVDAGGGQVAGVSIEDQSGNQLVTVGSTGVSGTLTVNQGAERDLEIVLRDANGGAVSLGLAQSVRVTVVNSQVASWEPAGGTSGTLVGRTRGNTTLRVDVISAGSIDFGSPSIPVRVN